MMSDPMTSFCFWLIYSFKGWLSLMISSLRCIVSKIDPKAKQILPKSKMEHMTISFSFATTTQLAVQNSGCSKLQTGHMFVVEVLD